MKRDRLTMHVLSHTHWDREWYQPFQGYRQRLVFQTDRMMELLETRRAFKHFHLDGQTAVVEDYLAIRPEERERLLRHIRAGRVLVGPWFVMPDERVLSGESLVRNLILGHELCAEYGTKPMPIGYVTDIFGHCSQFPQILRGFGINAAMLHRGTSCAREKAEMVWEGADGSEVLLVAVYQYTGYNDFMTFREWTDDELRAYEKTKLALATTDVLYGLDGNDHQPARWDIPEEMARVNRIFTGIRCVHSSMPKFLDALWKALGRNWTKGRKRFVGELTTPAKEGQWSETMFGFGSSRVDLKQANDSQEQLLSRVAEPLHAWAVLVGGRSQKSFLDLAWRYLLLNHPHDSICGCSLDQVHRDMHYRFDQSHMLATDSIWESVQAVGDRIDTARLGGGDAVVTVFNSAAAPTGPVTEFSFDINSSLAVDKEKAGLVPVLIGADGREIRADLLGVERRVKPLPYTFITDDVDAAAPWIKHRPGRGNPAYKNRHDPADRFHVAVPASIGALGYNSWRIAFKPRKSAAARLPKGIHAIKVDSAARTIENDSLRLTAGKDGLIELYDKSTRTRYSRLHAFEDCGDAGEGWNHRYPGRDTVVLSTDRKARGAVTVKTRPHGALSASIEISFSMRVPADLVKSERGYGEMDRATQISRSDRKATLRIATTFTVTAGSTRVDCRTVIHNTAQCHRMRVLFPTGRKTDVWFSDSAFDIVRRKVKLIDTAGWKEQAREEQIMKSFAAVADKRAGLAVLTKGLNEAAVKDDPFRTLALTLFRGFRENLAYEITRDSQLLGDLTFEYALLPFRPEAGAVPPTIFAEVDRFKLPLFTYARAPQCGDLPPQASLIEISAPAAISTIKTSQDGCATILRVFNPSPKPVTANIRADFAYKSAWKADLQERPVSRLAGRRVIRLPLRGKEVATIRFDRG